MDDNENRRNMKREKKEITVAAALKYESAKDNAPRVTAKGRGDIADKIIAEARRHGIPIQEDPALVQILSRLDIDEHIPPEIYKAVAEILAFVYSLNERYRQEKVEPLR